MATSLLALTVASARIAAGQAVTLPSIRVTGPSAQEKLLNRAIAAGRRLYDTTVADTALRLKAVRFQRVLDRLALSAVTERQLSELQHAKNSEDSAHALRGPRPVDPDREALAAVRALFAHRPNAGGLPEVSEFETGDLISSVREAETDQVRGALLDTISMAARAVVIERKLKNRWRFPVRSREQAAAFWRQPDFSTLNVGAVSGGSSGGASFTELASPFLHALRVSVNAVLAAEKGDDSPSSAPVAAARVGAADDDPEPNDAAVTRFVNGGGLLNLSFAYPAVYAALPNGALSAMVLAVPRFGATVPALGASQRDTTLMYDAGIELHLKSVDVVDGVGVFIQARSALSGGTAKFGELLGVDKGRNHFGYSTLSTGFSFGGRYLITASHTLLGPRSLRDLGWQVGFTALRGPAS